MRLRPPWSLRRRLVVAVVGMLAVVAIVIGAVSVLALQHSLMDRLDQQLSAASGRSQNGLGGPPRGSEQPNTLAGLETRAFASFSRQGPGTVLSISSSTANLTPLALVKGQDGEPTSLSRKQAAPFAAVSSPEPTTVSAGSLGSYRAVAVAYDGDDGSTITVVTALSLDDVESTVSQLILVIAIVTAAGLVLAGLAGTWIVRVALRPLERVVATATRVSELPLDRGDVAIAVRVPDPDTDPRTEVGQVGAAINSMLGHVASALSARQASENRVRQFVADASHELRTPLASIRGYAELTRRGDHELPPDVVRSIGRVESEAKRMTSLVEDLLLLARLDEGRDLQSAPLDLSRLLIDVVSDAHAAGPEHRWSLDLAEEPVTIDGDEARLHQVFANLLANARVHTPAGTSVVVALTETADAATVTITDDGPGIPPALRPVLFERFARGDGSRSRAAGSTGLGLAIVSAVVEGHGGDVAVESEPGRTAFRVTLPRSMPRG